MTSKVNYGYFSGVGGIAANVLQLNEVADYTSKLNLKNRIMNTDKTSIENESQPSCLGAIMRSAFAVIPDAERLDIGSNKIIAVFKHRHQAEQWAKSMWEKFYLIEEVQSEHFS